MVEESGGREMRGEGGRVARVEAAPFKILMYLAVGFSLNLAFISKQNVLFLQ